MQPLRPDATTALLRALRERIGTGTDLVVERVTSKAWASATFTGARHILDLRLAGTVAEAAADALLANLDEAEFRLRGHILADIGLVTQHRYALDGAMVVALSLEALTVEDA